MTHSFVYLLQAVNLENSANLRWAMLPWMKIKLSRSLFWTIDLPTFQSFTGNQTLNP